MIPEAFSILERMSLPVTSLTQRGTVRAKALWGMETGAGCRVSPFPDPPGASTALKDSFPLVLAPLTSKEKHHKPWQQHKSHGRSNDHQQVWVVSHFYLVTQRENDWVTVSSLFLWGEHVFWMSSSDAFPNPVMPPIAHSLTVSHHLSPSVSQDQNKASLINQKF